MLSLELRDMWLFVESLQLYRRAHPLGADDVVEYFCKMSFRNIPEGVRHIMRLRDPLRMIQTEHANEIARGRAVNAEDQRHTALLLASMNRQLASALVTWLVESLDAEPEPEPT